MNTQHAPQLIEVVLTWGRDVVEVRHLDHTDAAHASLSVGTRPQDDLFLPLAHASSVELLARAPQGWVVTPLDGGAPVLVADVAARPGGEELAHYEVGPFTVTIRRIEKARRFTLVPVFDALWANVATVTIAAMMAVVLVATFLPEGSVDNPQDPSVNMQRFMTLATKAPEKPKAVASEEKAAAPSETKTAANAKASKPKPQRSQEVDAQVVEAKLAMLFGDGAAGSVLSGGGKEGALVAALGEIGPGKVAAAGAYLGLKPGRPGGTGTTGVTGTFDVGRIQVGDVVGSKGELKSEFGPRGEHEVTTVAMTEPVVPPNVDKELIRKVVRSHVDQARHCYEKSLQANAGLGGKVSLKWTIAADGGVSHAQHVRSGAGGRDSALDDVGACLAKAVRTWRFPKLPGVGAAGVVVQYPFVFKAG
jgi:hypothetical protein